MATLSRSIRLVLALALLLAFALPAGAAPGAPTPDASSLAVPGPAQPTIDKHLVGQKGVIKVVVGLADKPLVSAVGADFKQAGSQLSAAEQKGYVAQLQGKQTALLAQVNRLGGKEIARLTKALNAVVISIDASQLTAVAALPGVVSVRAVKDYELDLSETVPYIGAAAAQNRGVDGTGVRVAVLDSGIDYTHYNLGGGGTIPDYLAAYGPATTSTLNTTRDGLFPTWKVVEGIDFVGEGWPNTAETTDPDPIDCSPATIGCAGGHGTHVADIIAGKSLDGVHKGVAPGASLLAVKVCSSVSSSCSGVALLLGMDYAMDPNNDGSLADAVDVVNMSLGSNYGQQEDDLSLASKNAVNAGIVVVASAGNGSDRPYVLGSPSSQPEVISVAQTAVPSAKLYLITAGAVSVGGSHQPWSGAPTLVSGVLAYDTTNTGTKLGCSDAAGTNPYAPGSHSGQILLVDRGTCAVSFKVANAEAAGAIAAVIANNAAQAPGDLPPDFSYGGGAITIAGFTITQADGTALKTVVGQTATINPASAVSLVQSMVSSSSRGPSMSFNAIKPDVGAPGASVSAEVGTGTGETAFGGTSGAAPMVSGAAAILLQAFPSARPSEIKARLMNNGETDIYINPVGLPGYLAPVTRIGGGEVRVIPALDAKTGAWELVSKTASLSFGYQAVTGVQTFHKTVAVRNYTNKVRTYSISYDFRHADDEASGAVTLVLPTTVTVPANGAATFPVTLRVRANKLPTWALNGGALGGNGRSLDLPEYDGYIRLCEGTDNVHVAWQILPHKAANTKAAPTTVSLHGGGLFTLSNGGGAVAGRVEEFALLGTSPKMPKSALPNPGDNYAVIDLKEVGARLAGSAIQFAVTTYGERSHPNYPAEFDVYVDSNMDGTDDYVVYNLENGGFGASGQNVVRVYNLTTNTGTVYYYTDADLDSANAILTAPLAALGLTASSQFNFTVFGCDNYFTGLCFDGISTPMTFTPDAPRFYSIGIPGGGVPVNGTVKVTAYNTPGGKAASPSQTGLLLLYRDGKPMFESQQILIVR